MQQEIINFTDPLDFVYDTSKVIIDENGARLKELIPDATFVQSFKVGLSADYPSTANLGQISNNGINSIGSKGFAEFSGPNKNITYSLVGATPLQKGTIQFKYMPLYSGSPSERQYLVSQSGNIVLQHAFNGNIEYRVWSDANLQMEIVFPWSPDANVLYDIEINYDFIQGESRLFINGVKKAVATGVTGQKADISQFKMGGTQTQNFKCYGFAVTEGISHVSDYAVGGPIEPTTFSEEYQRIEVNSPILTNSIGSIELDYVTPPAPTIRYLVNVNGIDKAYVGSQWIDVTAATNTSPTNLINNISSLDLTGGALVKIIPLIRSFAGSDSPIQRSITVNYSFNLPTDFKVSTCVVYGYVFDHSGLPVEGAKVEIDGTDFFFSKPVSSENTRPSLITRSVEGVTDSEGRWGIPIVETVTDGTDVTFTISYNNANGKKIKNVFKNVVIPNQLVAALGDLV